MNTIHLVLYANREPYLTIRSLLANTIKQYSNYAIRVHEYSLESIKQCDWFYKYGLCDLPNNINIEQQNCRDGYSNLWKPFIVNDVYNQMGPNDIVYYVDSSQHFKSGFTESIDKLCNYAYSIGAIAGSAGYDINNYDYDGCNKIKVWKEILKELFDESMLSKKMILNSWFIFRKDELNTKFINDWMYYSMFKNESFKYPLGTYHHTIDQSIFNILVHKYNLPFFYCDTIKHNDNKDRNLVLKIINSSEVIDSYFIRFNQ